MRDMMHRLIDSFAAAYLEPMTRSELYRRMCMNLVSPLSPEWLSVSGGKTLGHLSQHLQGDSGPEQGPVSPANADHPVYPSRPFSFASIGAAIKEPQTISRLCALQVLTHRALPRYLTS